MLFSSLKKLNEKYNPVYRNRETRQQEALDFTSYKLEMIFIENRHMDIKSKRKMEQLLKRNIWFMIALMTPLLY